MFYRWNGSPDRSAWCTYFVVSALLPEARKVIGRDTQLSPLVETSRGELYSSHQEKRDDLINLILNHEGVLTL